VPLRQTPSTRRTLAGAGIAATAVLVAVLGAAPGLTGPAAAATEVTPTTPTGTTTVQATPERVTNTTGVSGVLAWNTNGWPGDGGEYAGSVHHEHVSGPVKYAVTPPVGGPHNKTWMNAGVYTKPVPSERAVHNLEHGAVWITYRPDVSPAAIDHLTAFVDRQKMISEGNRGPGGTAQANRYIDLSPWTSNSLPAPIVISSWGYQLRVNSGTDPRLQQFVDTFRCSSKYSPEHNEPVDGQIIRVGGNPARDGSLQPNPA
jgi:hypothetical protein